MSDERASARKLGVPYQRRFDGKVYAFGAYNFAKKDAERVAIMFRRRDRRSARVVNYGRYWVVYIRGRIKGLYS